MKTGLAALAVVVMGAGAAWADVTQDVIDGLKAEGFTHIEIEKRARSMKVEATNGTVKVERVIDTATGAVMREETHRVRTRAGSDDMSGDDMSGDDDSGHDEADDDSNDHDSNDDHGGRGNDDGPDHDAGDDHGGDRGGHDRGRGGDDD